DPGAIGRTGLREKEITLDIAKRLRDLLVRDGFHVVMTRYDDRFIALDRRTVIANEERADLFVSVHANASKSRSVEGYEVYYLSEATDDHARAVAASENAQLPSEVEGGLALSVPESTLPIVWDLLYTEHRAESTALAGSVAQGIRGAGVSTPNRGVKSARFFVLKGTRMPAVLVEVGFISSLREEDRLRSAGYRQQLAEGIRNGILSYRKRHEQES
ncbi:MAG: N-acetylmuramoyl-L-alanine amidase, partial [Candidatus Omnitrophica bacterium CG11_big_fil_rev_8_21_14_0_20_64_10]